MSQLRTLRLIGVPWLAWGPTLPCIAELSPELMAVWTILIVGVTRPWRSDPDSSGEVRPSRGPHMDLAGALASGEEGAVDGAA